MISKDTTNGGAVIDGVHRFPESGIKVIIVGAGVGGLATALECWRKGCDVVVLERAEKLSTLGMQATKERRAILIGVSR